MESVLPIQKGFEDLANQTFRYDSQALALLGIRTSVVVATILSIPDAVALIPTSETVTAWILALVGCWTTALVLWFVFFVAFLHLMRFLAGGICVGPNGVRLWRLGRVLPWDSICAIAIEEETILSQLFSFKPTVRRLTLFTHMKSSSKLINSVAVPHYVASFFFSPKKFNEMCHCICNYKYDFDTAAAPAILTPPAELRSLKRAYTFIRWQRVVISILIAVSIGLFLSRKAFVLYSYNEGQKAFRQNDFRHAEDCFLTSVQLDRSFAPAYHGLAGSEFNLGKFEEARQNWKEALKWKPDFVEAKVSLAYLSLQQRDFAEAEKHINSALSLAPANPTALLNRADLSLRCGHVKEAIQDARLVITQSEPAASEKEVYMATCLLAQGKLLQGKPQEAAQLLAPLPVSQERLSCGQNLTYRLLVGAQTALALHQLDRAEKLARMAMHRAENVDTLLVMARVRQAREDYEVAQSILEKCRNLMPSNPWIYIQAAELNIARKHSDLAEANLAAADQCRPIDSLCLSRIAQLYFQLGKTDLALASAKRSLAMEPIDPVLNELVEKLSPQTQVRNN